MPSQPSAQACRSIAPSVANCRLKAVPAWPPWQPSAESSRVHYNGAPRVAKADGGEPHAEAHAWGSREGMRGDREERFSRPGSEPGAHADATAFAI
jgi:hypothetical protein